MSFKLRKEVSEIPTPGKILSADIQEISLVDNPANGRKFLLKKRMVEMDEELKKKLQSEGFKPDEIEKVLKSNTEEEKKGIFVLFKRAFGMDKEPDKTEKIDKSLDERLSKIEKCLAKLDKKQPEQNDVNDKVALEKKIETLENEIKIEEETQKNSSDLQQKVEELEKKLDELKKARTGGNSVISDNNSTLTEEEINKKQSAEFWKGTALDFGF